MLKHVLDLAYNLQKVAENIETVIYIVVSLLKCSETDFKNIVIKYEMNNRWTVQLLLYLSEISTQTEFPRIIAEIQSNCYCEDREVKQKLK